MKILSFVVIITVILGIYCGANYYVFIRGWQSIPHISWVRYSYTGLFIFLSFSYLISKAFEHTTFIRFHHTFYWVGSFWFAALLYFFLSVLIVDLLRLSDLGLHFLPIKNSLLYIQLKTYSFAGIIVIVSLILSYGHWNARHPKIKRLDLTINKNSGDKNEITIAMVSDIHLGTLLGKKRITGMVEQINGLKPDIVLFVGDVLDEVQTPIFRNDVGGPIRNLRAPLGVYGITGNHEYIGGIKRSAPYLESLNIKLIRDTVLLIDNKFYLAGRDDKDVTRFTGKKRKPLKEILTGINKQIPLILLDHQPFRLNEAVENGVDLQLSGHTHHGQFWPLNLITRKVYEVSWGYKQKGNTHFYVSCGYGYWGPPIRIGNTPEIVLIKLMINN